MTSLLHLLLASQAFSAQSSAVQSPEQDPPDGLGYHLCPLDDVDGDKCADFAIDDGSEMAWVISGKTGKVLATHHAYDVLGTDPVRQVQLVPLRGDLDGDGHWDVLDLGNGLHQPRIARSGRDLHSLGREFGISTDGPWYFMERPGIGDWDGDRIPDLISRAAAGEPPGFVVLSGRMTTRLATFQGPEFAGKHCLCTGDYDHDGADEVLVADGAAWSAFLLGRGREEPLATLQDDGDLPGAAFEEAMSCAAIFVPDMDGDKRDDVLFVRPELGMWTDVDASRKRHAAHPSYGKAVIRSSSTGMLLKTLDATLAMSECDGAAAARLPDVDRDGVPDFAVGYDRWWGEGRVVVYSGRTGSAIREHAGTPQTHCEYCSFGSTVAGMQDADGDGVGDYLVGSTGGMDHAGPGCVTLYSGADGHILHAIWKRDLLGK
jgi:hypothetical protein